MREARPAATAGLYVCGITPYDATHLGHAATYLAYDTLIRLWMDAGYPVTYVQNTTDVDDPLLERARDTGVDWRELADSQTELFRGDMEALRILPPDSYIAVTEVIEETANAVKLLLDRGIAYWVENDVYFDSAAAEASTPWTLGDESRLDRATMLQFSAERGGDPDRVGKHDPLDPLLWRGARLGDPSWTCVLGEGRPGWHIECSVIAQMHLELPFTVQGGGSDLIFPHHEFSAGHATAMTGKPFAELYSHAGLVGYEGEKMSKSLGNLVLVSRLTSAGVDPRAIRLTLLAQHYREDWEYTADLLEAAQSRLARWDEWASAATDSDSVDAPESPVLAELRRVLAVDLDTPAAVAAIDAAITAGAPATSDDVRAVDTLLGIRLR